MLGELDLRELDLKDFSDKVNTGEYKIIDLRTQQEREIQGYIKGTTNFIDTYNQEEIQKFIKESDKNGKYLLYCYFGHRSISIFNSMELAGFKNVGVLKGGLQVWEEEGYPLVKN